MTRNSIQNVLENIYPVELVDALLKSYEKALGEYKKGHWQYFGNEIGQFVEVSRRIVEFQLSNKYTLLTDKLPIFNEKVLKEWESNYTNCPEEFRIIIPRCLYSMYCIRNKRGMIHKNHIDPNKMDATMLLENTKWVLAEIFRLASTMSFEETEEIVNAIMCKEVPMIWDTGNCLRILNTKMTSKDKVICLLYIRDCMTDLELQSSIEYKNLSDFRKVLRALHKDRLIEYQVPKCILSPLGINRAEELVNNS